MYVRRLSRRRRGTAYVLALAVTSLLIVLGLTATQIARGELEQNSLEQDEAKARIAAHYTLDYIHKFLDGSIAWRGTAKHETWSYFAAIDDVMIFYGYQDQIDGDMTNDPAQPFMVYAMAISGDARRVYRVELISDADGNLTRNSSKFEQVTFEALFE